MSIRDRITKLLSRNRQGQEPPTTTSERGASASGDNSLYHLFMVEKDRNSRVLLSRRIYDEDTRMEGICSTLARDVAAGAFQIEVQDEEAAQIATDLRNRLKLDAKIDDWCRLSFRDGDSFLELGVGEDNLIHLVTRKPTLNMRRNSDDSDRFPDPRLAYWYADHINQMQPNQKTIWFAEWQIIHARWAHDEGSRYGRPILASGQKAWKKIEQGETNVAVRRATRAGMRYLHVVEGDQADVEKYKEANKAALSSTAGGVADFFSNKQGGLSTVSGDTQIGSIDDIIHHIETWFVGSPVPRGLIGYGRDLNRDVLDEQKQQYDETLEAVKKWAADQLLKPLFELQWLLMGKVPDLLDYEITWPSKKKVTPAEIVQTLQAAQLMRGLGFSEEVIQLVVSRYLPGIDPDMLTMDGTGTDADRLAVIDRILNQTANGNNNNPDNGRASGQVNGNNNVPAPAANGAAR